MQEDDKVYAFNFLVSYPWSMFSGAKQEIEKTLRSLGDDNPIVERTAAKGIIGVKTRLDSREVVKELRKTFAQDPMVFQFTHKWVPVDFWTYSDINSLKEAVMSVKDKVRKGEQWRMTVEKRRYTLYHKTEIIKQLAEVIQEKVNLRNPDKIIRIDIIGKYAGISILSPIEVFSTTKLPMQK